MLKAVAHDTLARRQLEEARRAARRAAVRGCRGRHRGQLRILPAEDREDGGDALGERSRRWSRSRPASSRSPTARAARPASAPTRRSRGSRARRACTAAAHLTCVDASRGEIDDDRPRLLGRRRPPHRRAARRSARAGQAPSRRTRTAMPMPPSWSPGLKRVAPFEISVAAYPGMPSGRGQPAPPTSTISRRKIDAGATGRSPSSSSRPSAFFRFRDARGGGRDRRRDRARHPAGLQRRPDAQVRGACAARRSRPGWTGCSRGSTICPPRASWSPRPSPPSCARELYAGGVRHFHFYTLNRAELSYAICHLLGLQTTERTAMTAADAA